MTSSTVRAAETLPPCMGPSAGNTGGSSRPVNKLHRTRPLRAGVQLPQRFRRLASIPRPGVKQGLHWWESRKGVASSSFCPVGVGGRLGGDRRK